MTDLLIWFTTLCALCAVGCYLADDTTLGAALAAGVKGRPYIPTHTQE